MSRTFALALLLGLAAPVAAAQPTDLVGTWEVERAIDSTAESAPDSGLSALLPDSPYSLAPIRVRFDASGRAVVTLLVARHDGYEVLGVPSTYTVADGRLALSLGDVDSEWEIDRQGDVLDLRAGDGSTLSLRRAP